MHKTDHALWVERPAFGVAGGPKEVVLTDEGSALAFAVGAQVRRGPTAQALEALYAASGRGYLSIRAGCRHMRTGLGRFDQVAWGYLRAHGLAQSFQDDKGDGVELTALGMAAAERGIEERERLLARCQVAARLITEPAQ